MNRALSLLALVLLAGAAYFVRTRAGADHVLGSAETAAFGTHWLVDDARTATHLRRIELAIAADDLPALDRWLEHPRGGEVPALPLFDVSLAAIAERIAGDVQPIEGYVDQGEVEHTVLSIPPWIGALTVLLLAWAVRGFIEGRSAFVASILAASVFALAPASVRSGAAGQLDPAVWLALLAALLLGLAVRALRTSDPLDAILGALACGVVGGLALTSAFAGGALFAGVWIGFATRALVAAPAERALAYRAGLCYCAVAAFVAQMPSIGGAPDVGGAWIVSAWCSCVSQLVMYAAIPFLLGIVHRSRARVVQTISFAVGIGLLVYFAPDTFRRLTTAVKAISAWRSTNSLFAGDASAWSWSVAFHSLTPAAVLFPLAVLWLVRRLRAPENALLLGVASTSLAAACFDSRQLVIFAVPMACGVALLAAEGLAAPMRAVRTTSALVCAVCMIALSLEAQETQPESEPSDAQREWVRGLRWIREQTPSAGAFNAPAVPGEYAVLCTPAMSALVVYHARRPTLASLESIPIGDSNLPEIARTLTSSDVGRLVRVMHAAGARYVVASPQCLSEFAALESSAGRRSDSAREESLLWRLSVTATDGVSPTIDGFTRVYASSIRIAVGDKEPADGFGPAISVWRLDAPRPPPAPARMSAR